MGFTPKRQQSNPPSATIPPPDRPTQEANITSHHRIAGPLLAVGLIGAVVACSPTQGGPLTNAQDAPFVLAGLSAIERVCQLTGPGAYNDTATVKVAGADLGSMFEAGGRTYFAFGDTFGERAADAVGGVGGIWRSNTMAWTTDTEPSDCIKFDGWVTDEVGWAQELLSSKKRDDDEMTVIPTYGFEANGAMYLHFMSVKHWGDPGEWETNFAGLARSTDAGQTWDKLPDVTWPGMGSFQQVSVSKVDGELYFWGIPSGRLGGVQLMKVAEKEVERLSAYRYFQGTASDGSPQWSSDAKDARTIIDRETGELSVVWNAYLGRWLMTTMADNADAVMYEGITPWGPWGTSISLFTQQELPGLYAPFLSPNQVSDGGRTVYFGLSIWGPYNVFWYRARLDRAS
ncbi:MAG: DUF4185 domain-containing protein [Chloroflexi bacterium]|nr:DUF4185 domain-containing protein [Chloroflexota bacterium]